MLVLVDGRQRNVYSNGSLPWLGCDISSHVPLNLGPLWVSSLVLVNL